MNARNVALPAALLLIAVAAAAPQQASPLTGAWTRVSLKDSTGKTQQPPSAPNFVIFSANGFFSQSGIPAGRPKVDKEVKDMTREELVARFDNVDSWRGTYTISGNKLTRKSVADIDPTSEGTELVQTFRIAGDTLVLKSPSPASQFEARFVRAR